MERIELVVTDLDGTLWDSDERIHHRTLEALHLLEERGVPLLVATGRRPRSAAAGLARENLSPPAVFLDGAIGRDADSIFHESVFDPHDAARVLDTFEQAGLSPCVYVARDDIDVVVSSSPSTHPRHLEVLGPWLQEDDLDRAVTTERIYAFGMVGADTDAVAGVGASIDGSGHAVVVGDRFFGGSSIMVRPHGTSKWSGVESFCAQRGIHPGSVLAVGDGENDVELLASARVSCVVSDGCDAALALADHVIDPASVGGWSRIIDLI